MANTIQIKRGLQAAFDLGVTLAVGELCVCSDTGNVYIGATSGIVHLNPESGEITLADITDAGTAAAANTGTAAGNVPVLDANGKLAQSVIPAIAVTDTFVVADEEEMLALEAEKGDVAIRTDESKTYILQGDDPTDIDDWAELKTPTDAVASVNGKTGTVTLTASDVGALASNATIDGGTF